MTWGHSHWSCLIHPSAPQRIVTDCFNRAPRSGPPWSRIRESGQEALESGVVRFATLILVAAAMMPACTAQPAAAPPLEVRVPEYLSSESFAARMFHEYAEQSSRLQFRFVPTVGT